MARRRFRDRFFTPPVARAITSPLGILLAGVGGAAGILLAGPIAGIALGVAAWAGRVAVAVPRDAPGEKIDPYTLSDPWRRFVQDALQAQESFQRAVRAARPGPLRERLVEVGDRIGDGVQECWRVAQRGQAMGDARKQMDTAGAERDLAEMVQQAPGPWGADSATQRTIDALNAQLASAKRMESQIVDTRDQLRLLNARLDEAVARAIELSATRPGEVADLTRLGNDVDTVVADMEALRQGLEEVGEASSPGTPATGTA